MQQTWKINGQVYNHSQLMEMKRQGLNPRKDQILLKSITNQKAEEVVETPVETVVEDLPVETTEVVEEVVQEVAEEPVEVVEESSIAESENATDEQQSETEEEEFARLKTEKAWLSPAKKERYNELKAKFTS